MPAEHDLDPLAMTDDERRRKRVQEAAIAFEMQGDDVKPEVWCCTCHWDFVYDEWDWTWDPACPEHKKGGSYA